VHDHRVTETEQPTGIARPSADDPRIDELLTELTLDEKAVLTGGSDSWHTTAVERLGIPALKVTDGPNGARGDAVSGATAACFPVGVALAASWDPDLLARIGGALAEEARSKQASVLLGPTVNIHRTPLGGRNFECYSEDPHLTGTLATAFIRGLQGAGVGASLKHLVANDSEFERMTISSDVDERTLREIYLRPFEMAVADADPWTIMGSYNRLNGVHACENRWLLTDVLRTEWGWDGVVVSDWLAVHSTAPTLSAGLDLEMPGPPAHLGAAVADPVRAGDVDEDHLDASVRRLLRLLIRTGRLDSGDEQPECSDDRPEVRALARQAAVAGMVLLRNEGGVLPLDAGRLERVAVVGPNAEEGRFQGGGSSIVRPHYVVHPLAALRERLEPLGVTVDHAVGSTGRRFLIASTPETWAPSPADPDRPVTLEYFTSTDLSGAPLVTKQVRNIGALWFGYNVGGLDPDHFSCRYRATFVPDRSGPHGFEVAATGTSRVLIDDAEVVDNWTSPVRGRTILGWGTEERATEVDLEAGRPYEVVVEYARDAWPGATGLRFGLGVPEEDLIGPAVAAARAADVVVLVAGSSSECESEGYDRPTMTLAGDQDDLIQQVAAANPNTVVVLNSGSPVEMPWVDDVAAVLQVWFPGQEMGNALADVLLGDAEPGGRLPTTFPRRLQDCPAWLSYPGEGGRVRYGEGVFVGYRGYDELGTDVLFPFGHGLGYTSFEYHDLVVSVDSEGQADVEVTVRNSGDRTGSEVVQVYVGDPLASVRRPPRELKGAAKVRLAPGDSDVVRIHLDRRAFAFFDPPTKRWVVEPGEFKIAVGSSSRHLRASTTIVL
jgi:beta-glucosidase